MVPLRVAVVRVGLDVDLAAVRGEPVAVGEAGVACGSRAATRGAGGRGVRQSAGGAAATAVGRRGELRLAAVRRMPSQLP